MGRKALIAAIGVAFAVVFALEASAQRACTSLHDEKPRRGLPYSNATIVADKVQIDHAQKPHFIKLFSETAQKGKRRFEQCFRYEAESENEVRRFHWPLAGIRADRLSPGLEHRRSMNHVQWIDRDPQVVPTRVFAFENAAANSKAWASTSQTGTQAQVKSAKETGQPRFVAVAPDTVVAGLRQFLELRKLPVFPAVAYYPSESSSASYILQDSYTGPSFKIEVRSDATLKGNRVAIRTEMVASGPGAEKARYAMPAFRALRQTEGPVGKLESYEKFIKAFDQGAQESERHQEKWIFTQDLAVSDLAEGVLFRVRHPITVEWDGQRDCFLAATYSPLALNFSLQHCPLFAR